MSAFSVVVRAPNWIGDHVMAERFYRSLRGFPNATITLLAPDTHRGLWTEFFDDTIYFSRREAKTLLGFRRLVSELRRRRFAFAFSTPASLSAAALLRAAGIPRRIGFAETAARLLLTDPIPWPGRETGRRKADMYLDLLKPAKVPIAEERFIARTGDPAGPILVAPGASIELRRWPHFPAWVAARAAQEPQRRFIVVGGPADRDQAEKIVRAAPGRVEDRTGKTSLPELVGLCRGASLVLANDSGVAHIAASVAGAPTAVLFGPGDPNYIAPVGPQVRHYFVEGLTCRPCESRKCKGPYEWRACLERLAPETIERA